MNNKELHCKCVCQGDGSDKTVINLAGGNFQTSGKHSDFG